MKYFWIIGWVGLLIGCQSPGTRMDLRQPAVRKDVAFTAIDQSSAINPDWLATPTAPFTLGPGDRLELEIMGQPASHSILVVGPDGRIYFDLLPGVDVWGKTISETKTELERGLMKYMRDQPQVSVVLRAVESKRVWVLGRLNAPGIYTLSQPTRLLEGIALAGGLAVSTAAASLPASQLQGSAYGMPDETADLRHSFLIRKGQFVPVDFQRLLLDGDMSQNIYLQPDDFVYVPSLQLGTVYIIGAVLQPKALRLTDRMTLSAALTSAGGVIKDAYLSHVAIVRGSLTQPRIAIVNGNAILSGAEPDVLIEPGDIVYVPTTPYQILSHYVNLILDTFVSTWAANSGARVISRQAGQVGVNVPLPP